MSNVVLERIHQFLVNLVCTCNITQFYVYKDDPWLGIVDVAVFSIISTTNGIKDYSPFQLIFCRDMIIPIKNMVSWGLIRKQNQTQINKDNIRENRN